MPGLIVPIQMYIVMELGIRPLAQGAERPCVGACGYFWAALRSLN